MMPVRLEPAAPRSLVKHSTTVLALSMVSEGHNLAYVRPTQNANVIYPISYGP